MHPGEQHAFLLLVVATICETPYEICGSEEKSWRHRLAFFKPVGGNFQVSLRKN
jgi:hypothetical protein